MFRMTLLFADSFQAVLDELMQGKKQSQVVLHVNRNKVQQYFCFGRLDRHIGRASIN